VKACVKVISQAYNNLLEMSVGQRNKQIDIQQALKKAEVEDDVTYDLIRASLKRCEK
jgi:hypothetical protein